MTCSQTKKGNLFSNSSKDGPPYSGAVEKVCKDDNNYSRQYTSYSTSAKPNEDERISIAKSLEQSLDKPTGLLSNVANAFKNVFGGPVHQRRTLGNSNNNNNSNNSNNNKEESREIVLQDQDWPTPAFEDDDEDGDGDGDGDGNAETSGGTRRKKKASSSGSGKKRKSKQSLRRKVSNRSYSRKRKASVRKSVRKKSFVKRPQSTKRR